MWGIEAHVCRKSGCWGLGIRPTLHRSLSWAPGVQQTQISSSGKRSFDLGAAVQEHGPPAERGLPGGERGLLLQLLHPPPHLLQQPAAE